MKKYFAIKLWNILILVLKNYNYYLRNSKLLPRYTFLTCLSFASSLAVPDFRMLPSNKRYALSHFAKGDTSHHSAVYNILNWQEARILYSSGIRYYNWEQDLGIEGLRQSKLKYRPAFFLHKYRVKDDQ